MPKYKKGDGVGWYEEIREGNLIYGKEKIHGKVVNVEEIGGKVKYTLEADTNDICRIRMKYNIGGRFEDTCLIRLNEDVVVRA